MTSDFVPEPGTPPADADLLPAVRELVHVVARLRSPEGCPWDRAQTLASIKPYTLEETYELLEAIDQQDDSAICEELGDVLLQVLLDSQIAADEGKFDLVDVVKGLTAKMIERHPHVFGESQATTHEEISRNWDRIKQSTKLRSSIFEGIPVALPALARSAQLKKKASRAGFDFPVREMLWTKLQEELSELTAELFPGGRAPEPPLDLTVPKVADDPLPDLVKQRVSEELGDVMFVLADIGRRYGVNAEEALRGANCRYERRLREMECVMVQQGKGWSDYPLEELGRLFQVVKQELASGESVTAGRADVSGIGDAERKHS